jgi:putative phosphoribosyl transferase
LATLLIDLLTSDEEAVDARTAHLRFNIELLTQRLIAATEWLARRADTGHLAIGYFGASTGAAAALVAATERSDGWGQLCRVVGGPIWQDRSCLLFWRLLCSSSAETISR